MKCSITAKCFHLILKQSVFFLFLKASLTDNLQYNTIHQMILIHMKVHVLDQNMIHNLAFVTSLGLYKDNQVIVCVCLYLSLFFIDPFSLTHFFQHFLSTYGYNLSVSRSSHCCYHFYCHNMLNAELFQRRGQGFYGPLTFTASFKKKQSSDSCRNTDLNSYNRIVKKLVSDHCRKSMPTSNTTTHFFLLYLHTERGHKEM